MSTTQHPLLAQDHNGMMVDHSGLLKQCRVALRTEPGLAEMLRQLAGHMAELGERYYAGDVAVVDEFLQLYCVAADKRRAVKTAMECP